MHRAKLDVDVNVISHILLFESPKVEYSTTFGIDVKTVLPVMEQQLKCESIRKKQIRKSNIYKGEVIST
jgi:hypothetical protein